MIALSTAWNAWRYSQARAMLDEISKLGFRQIELNFNLSEAMVKELIGLRKSALDFKIVSLHNFCPIPKGTARNKASPDMFSLSAIEEHQRQKALRYTKRTIQTASALGAQIVILHIGRIQMSQKIQELGLLYRNKNSHGYQDLKTRMLKERKAKATQFFSQVLKSLGELCAYALKKEVKLGIENRYYFNEIPSIEEMAIILNTFPSPPLYYWHDVGHAQLYENLHFFQHKTLLDKFSRRMAGVHLHDITGTDDHRAPLKGSFDFSLVKPYLTKRTLKVLEVHHPATANEIIQGKKYLEQLFAN